MKYRRHEGVPGRIIVESHGLGSWYKACLGTTFDVLIPNAADRAFVVMDTPHNRSVLPEKLMNRIPEDAPQGLTIYRKYAKIIDNGVETNESGMMFLQQNDWLWRRD